MLDVHGIRFCNCNVLKKKGTKFQLLWYLMAINNRFLPRTSHIRYDFDDFSLFDWRGTKYYTTGSAVKWQNFTLPHFFSLPLFRSVSAFYFTLAATFNFLRPCKFVVSENLVVIVTAVRELAWHDVNIEISYAPIHKAG